MQQKRNTMLIVLSAILACACVQVAGKESCSDLQDDWHLKGLNTNGTIVCEWGCWDSEDEACLKDTDQNGCAEIYGHVEWGKKCNCRNLETGEVLTEDTEGGKGGEANLYFSVPAFIVLFRESLEVVIVLAIIIQFLDKAQDDGTISEELCKRLKREVYIGASVGFVACLCLGVGIIALASLARGLFQCDGLLVFDGVIMLLTCIVLTFLALNFYKMIFTKEAHELKMQQDVDNAIAAAKEGDKEAGFGKKHVFLIFSFSTGLREGMESIIFLIGVISDFKDPSYISSLPIPIITALICSRIVGCIFFQGTKKMKVENFMRFCSILLLFVAAGFFSSSMHKWQELSAFGTWSPRADRPWQNQMVWDASDCCNDKTNRFFVLMRALLGWQDQPTPMEFFAYGLYWVVTPILGYFLIKREVKKVQEKLKKWREEKALREAQEPKVVLVNAKGASDLNNADSIAPTAEDKGQTLETAMG